MHRIAHGVLIVAAMLVILPVLILVGFTAERSPGHEGAREFEDFFIYR